MSISDNLKKKKAAIYIRVSTRYQVDKDSLQVQRRELSVYSEMVLGIPDYVIFEDAGYSAKNTDRPDYQLMMGRLRTGEFSHILVWKIDRISRNLLDFASMYKELKDLGVAFVSKNEQFDTSNAVGEAMLKIILVFAELERNMTSERVTAVMMSRASNGQWNGGRIPYGYIHDKETKQFSLDPVESKIVNMIWDVYEQYQSVNQVVKHLNGMGIKTRGEKDWTTAVVYKILTSVFYTGDYLYNVNREGSGYKKNPETEWLKIPNHHVPIISRERYDRVQYILKRNKRGGVDEGQSYIKKNIHIFAGLLRCAECGSNMSATLDKRRANGWRPSIYGCSKHRVSPAQCPNKYITDVTLGPFIFNYIANIIRAKGNVGPRTSLDVLEKKILRGSVFSKVDHIERKGLEDLYNILLSGKSGMEYRPPVVFNKNSSLSEKEVLEDRRRKAETAMNRLKSLYLYGDETLPKKDFVIEHERIAKELTEVEARLAELESKDSGSMLNSDSLIKKASYFIMVQKLLDDRYIDFESYIRKIDPSVPRNFLLTIIDKIEIDQGRVSSIYFKNGMVHHFIYK